MLGAPSFRVVCERVGNHEPKLAFHQELSLALEKLHSAAATRASPRLDRLRGDIRRALRQPLPPAPPALLLGRGRLLHPRGLGLLPHRLPDSPHHAQQCPSAVAQHLSRALLEGLWLL